SALLTAANPSSGTSSLPRCRSWLHPCCKNRSNYHHPSCYTKSPPPAHPPAHRLGCPRRHSPTHTPSADLPPEKPAASNEPSHTRPATAPPSDPLHESPRSDYRRSPCTYQLNPALAH